MEPPPSHPPTCLDLFFALAQRFEGVDLQSRRGFIHGPWRAKLISNKNSRDHYRLEAWGKTAEEAAFIIVTKVQDLDGLNNQIAAELQAMEAEQATSSPSAHASPPVPAAAAFRETPAPLPS
jgi:hypothetical protein